MCSIVTKLRVGPCQSKIFLYSVHIEAGAHPASSPVVLVISASQSFRGVKQTTRQHLVQKLNIHGAITLFALRPAGLVHIDDFTMLYIPCYMSVEHEKPHYLMFILLFAVTSPCLFVCTHVSVWSSGSSRFES